jgi:hypothetical protein
LTPVYMFYVYLLYIVLVGHCEVPRGYPVHNAPVELPPARSFPLPTRPPLFRIFNSDSLTRRSPPSPVIYGTLTRRSPPFPSYIRHWKKLLLPPCFYIAKCNERECCCIWLSGPGFQDLDIRLSGPGFQDLDKRTLGTGHRHSQSAPLPFLPGRARSSVREGPELRHAERFVLSCLDL